MDPVELSAARHASVAARTNGEPNSSLHDLSRFGAGTFKVRVASSRRSAAYATAKFAATEWSVIFPLFTRIEIDRLEADRAVGPVLSRK